MFVGGGKIDKFTHMYLLKNDVQLKKKNVTNNQPKKEKKKKKKKGRQLPKFIKRKVMTRKKKKM